jgi:ribosomal subunit interface protein
MKLQITGRNLDIGDALRAHITDRLEQVAGKYFTAPIDGRVTLEKEGVEFRAECLVHVGTGIELEARAHANDPYGAVDTALEKLEKRLRRYKRRLRDHHTNRREPAPSFAVSERVIEAGAETDVDENEPEGLNPVIIAETRANLQELTVGEAVMQLDISDRSFLVFSNGSEGRINVVYRRGDGNIGWIDPDFITGAN